MSKPSFTPRVRGAACAVLLVIVGAVLLQAKVKTTVKHDERFDFSTLHTYAWPAEGPGEVKLVITANDDPEPVRKQIEPIIVATVESELQKRGFVKATSGTPDFYVNYYALVTVGTSSQYMGQFASLAQWGLPPMAGATTAFSAVETGSLILDITSPAKQSVVWRGVAQAEIDREKRREERVKRIQDAMTSLLVKFPPKKK